MSRSPIIGTHFTGLLFPVLRLCMKLVDVTNQITCISCSGVLGLEDVHGPHDVLPADRALVHPLATFGAGDHVTTLQEDTVDHGVHADPAEVVILNRQWTVLAVCKNKRQGGSKERCTSSTFYPTVK